MRIPKRVLLLEIKREIGVSNICLLYSGPLEEKSGREGHEHMTDSQTGPEQGLIHGRNRSTGRELQRMTNNGAAPNTAECNTPPQTEGESDQYMASSSKNDTTMTLIEKQNQKKALMQCLLLEMGILFHSVFIGMALSVAVGNDFVVLLIAITFHRKFPSLAAPYGVKAPLTDGSRIETFEGLALGSRIAALSWRKHALQPWLMALAYGCTCALPSLPYPVLTR